MKAQLFSAIQAQEDVLCRMADDIYDNPETDSNEYRACALLSDFLLDNGFSVQVGIGGKETSFRAVWGNEDGPSIGLICEYDALEGIGHACGHHLQGPAVCGAAVALKNLGIPSPFRIVVYGTPAEEATGGKIVMLQNGCFRDIDAALMFHGFANTFVDNKIMASINIKVTFHGVTAHAATAPEAGRSALDALLLSFQGLEYLREHVANDVRMHYTVLDAGGPANVVPATAVGDFCLRSYNETYLQTVIKRFYNIVAGAALMTDTTYELSPGLLFRNKINVKTLDQLLLKNAEQAGACGFIPPRQQTGSTDFGNISHELPAAYIGVAFAPAGSVPHSQAFLDAGKGPEAHRAVITAAETLAGTAYDIITGKEVLQRIRSEFEQEINSCESSE